jgi:hypothetical protein
MRADLVALLRARGGLDNLAEELGQGDPHAARDRSTHDIRRPAARDAVGTRLRKK